MPKFSIIVPVYNVEDYIDKCLKSIFNQTYKDFEVIVIDDGTKDNSMDIVNKYDVIVVKEKNSGLSTARNNGVKKAKGEYLLFVDSDDYLEKDLLKNINDNLSDNPDVLRFQIKEVDEDKETYFNEKGFDTTNGVDAFNRISKYHYIENAWAYAFNRKYYLDNNYKFKDNSYHEDFGLIPLVIIKADTVKSISYIGYNYRQRNNSIMNNNDYDKTKKKVEDFLNHYKYLIKEIDKLDIDSTIFKSYISNSLIIKICELKGNDYKEYKKVLKKLNVYDNILSDTLVRKIKKVFFKISPKLSIKLIK